MKPFKIELYLRITILILIFHSPSIAQIPEVLWINTYGTSLDERAYSVENCPDGGYIIAGFQYVIPMQDQDAYVIKTDSDGDTVWTKTYGGSGGDRIHHIIPDGDDGFIMIGYTSSFGAGGNDYYLLKTNLNGDTLWTRTYGSEYGDEGNSLDITDDGGYILVGRSIVNQGGEKILVVKTDNAGDTLWTNLYGDGSSTWGYDVKQTSDGGYIVSGYALDAYILKLDSLGNAQWSKTYLPPGNEIASLNGILELDDGGYIAAGETGTFMSHSDIYLLRTNANGDSVWSRMYSFNDWELCPSLIESSDGNFLVCGSTYGWTGNSSAFVLKFNDSGDSLWTKIISDVSVSIHGNSIVLDEDDNFLIAGFTSGFPVDSDAILIKLSSEQVGIEDVHVELPIQEGLLLNYPNPFNSSATIEYGLPEAGRVRIDIYDLLGRKVETLNDEEMQAGRHQVVWDASGYSSGVYFYRIKAGDIVDTKRMVYLK
jgi:hypothetical protein